MYSPASSEHRRGLPDPGWLPFRMAQVVDKSKKRQSEFTSRWCKFFPFPEHGSNWWKAKCREAVEASANWREDDRVKSLTTSCCRKPVSSIQAECFFFFNSIALTKSTFTISRYIYKAIFLCVAAFCPHWAGILNTEKTDISRNNG